MAEPRFIITDPEYYEKLMVIRYEQLTGRTLYPGDPERLTINIIAYGMGLQSIGINESAKQNLLNYASGDILDELGVILGVTRGEATAAITTLQFSLPTPAPAGAVITAGTQVSAGNLVFRTLSEVAMGEGETSVTVDAECTTVGTAGNGLLPGQINTLAISDAYTVANITTSAGGTDIETDDELRERIHLAPESFSVAGPTGAYEYWAKTANSDISDVKVISPVPGVVAVYVLMTGGVLPTETILNAVLAVVNDEKIRPLTDYVQVLAPTGSNYSISLTWYIYRSYESLQSSIATSVAAAVADYIKWQKSVIGRDINPDVLRNKILSITGVKRVVITSPAFTALTDIQVAQNTTSTITYGGIENE